MDVGHGPPPTPFRDGHDGALWPAQPVQLARGRQPRDALAKTVTFNVSSMDDFDVSLREYLNSPLDQPEHTEAQFAFWHGASFLVTQPGPASASSTSTSNAHPPPASQAPHHVQQHPHAPPGYQPANNGLPVDYGALSHAYQAVADPALALAVPGYASASADPGDGTVNGSKKAEHKVSLSILEALAPTSDPKDKMRKQRAIAKCCVDAIQRTDGYRYSFHNCWNSREDDSFRFSYYCNDSLLNKDRAANGKGAKLGKRATKPVYDCKGVLSIKFSATKNTLDVFYKHVPIHKTYEERAPPPRKDSKRRKFLEIHDPDALERIASRPRTLKADSEDPESAGKSKKRPKPKIEAQRASNTSLESDLRAQSLRSLLELIQVDPPALPESSPPEEHPPPPLPPPPPPLAPSVQQPLVMPDPPPFPDTPSLQIHQMQTLSNPPRKRPRNSCDVCKAKKTKCDGTRPVCQTCIDKKRVCFYSAQPISDDQRQPSETNDTIRQAQPANNEISELEKIKKELEEAKAKIQELEMEKRAASTPIQTPQIAPRPQSQPQLQSQPHHRPQLSQSHTHQHVAQQQQQQPQQQRPQAPSNHRQQLQQLNQGSQRALGSPQQMAYKLDTQSPQQRQPLTPQQKLQAAAAQQMQSTLQTPQTYFTATHPNHSPYGTLNRPIAQNGHPIPTQPTQHLSQTQTQPQQMHANNTGLTPTAPPVDANAAFREYAWPQAAYYAYQNPQPQQTPQQQQQQQQHAQHAQQHQHQHQHQQQAQDQWAAARGSGVYR